MSTATLVIGPEDHGKRMTLNDFENAEGREGYLYELSRGVVTVIEVPHPRHGAQVDAIRQQLSIYRAAHPECIHPLLGGSDCKIPVDAVQSERHPDLALYLEREPDDGPQLWARWVPAIVIEVVSASSAHRDYNEKPQEYLQFGVKEYWIIDADKQQMTLLVRSRGVWKKRIVDATEKPTTPLLPGFEFDLGAVFAAAGGADD